MSAEQVRVALAVLATAVVVLLAGGGARAEAATGATGAVQVDGVRLQDDALLFSVTVPSAPVGTVLDPALTQLTVGGVEAQGRSGVVGEPGAVPAVVLVLDTSGSMRGAALAAAKQAATDFVRSLPDAVPVGMVTFADTAQVALEPTTDRSRVGAALGDLEASGETALYDAVTTAAGVGPGPRTLVVLSDGGDTASATDLTSTVLAVGSSGSRVEAIALQTDEFDLAPLSSVAGAGHGTVRTVDDGAGLAAAFASTTSSLSSRLDVVAFVPEGVGGRVELGITVGSGDERWSGVSAVDLPAGAARADAPDPAAVPDPATAGPEAFVVAPTPTWIPWALVAAAAGAVLLLAVAVAPRRRTDRQRREQALAAYTVTGRRRGPVTLPAPGPSQLTQHVLGAAEKVVAQTGSVSATAMRLDRAGLALRPHEWLVLRVGACLGVTALVALLTGWIVRGLLIGVLVGLAGTAVYLHRRQTRRTRRFADDLPDTLQLVASSLRTGFSLPQALDSAQGGAADPMSSELGRALAATRIGSELEDELDRVADRMRSEDWRWAVMAVRIQRSVGGNLAEVLMTTVTTLRERAATRRQVAALSAEGRLSGWILLALPIGLFLLLSVIRIEYISLLWTTVLGMVMLAVSVVLMGIGGFWMSRLVKVDA
jgi:tight adherence protein B